MEVDPSHIDILSCVSPCLRHHLNIVDIEMRVNCPCLCACDMCERDPRGRGDPH